MFRLRLILLGISMLLAARLVPAQDDVPPLPEGARLKLDEDWSCGAIDPARWYLPRKKWGDGNHGVVPENVSIGTDTIDGRRRNVLTCIAHGDEYDGPVVGLWGKRTRVGGAIVSRAYFASGRFEIVMKIGATERHDGGPADPARPIGSVPALWTYGYRFVEVPRKQMDCFVPGVPLYNPHMPAYGGPFNEYWSELDFPEFGKDGDFDRAMYNTFCQNRHHAELFPVDSADGQYHTYVTDWRTMLKPLPGVTDRQVTEHDGYWWVQDKSVPFALYLGNPLKGLGANRYAVYWGKSAAHWIDGRKVAENRRFVPAMAAQLNMGVWLPEWAGPAPWKTARMSVASVRVWQYDDEGDVRGVLTGDLKDSFDEQGNELR
ncbi:MAG: glycoside hydrolase family 16 protein [Thermoguttaceae bacterium]|nr:glycoside hydrolase family 16 protein [Thermoguttaceae bacterium]